MPNPTSPSIPREFLGGVGFYPLNFPFSYPFRHFVFSAERRGFLYALGLFFLRRYSIHAP